MCMHVCTYVYKDPPERRCFLGNDCRDLERRMLKNTYLRSCRSQRELEYHLDVIPRRELCNTV